MRIVRMSICKLVTLQFGVQAARSNLVYDRKVFGVQVHSCLRAKLVLSSRNRKSGRHMARSTCAQQT